MLKMIAKCAGMYKGVDAECAKWNDEQMEVLNGGPMGGSGPWYFANVAKGVAIGDEGRAQAIADWKKTMCDAFAPIEAKMKEKSWTMSAGNTMMPLDCQIFSFYSEFVINESADAGIQDGYDMMTAVFEAHPCMKKMVETIAGMDKCKAYLGARMKSPL